MGRVGSVLLCVLVLATLAVAYVPSRSSALTVTYSPSAETVARGTSTGFANEAYDDSATDTKTEGGTTRSAWLKPNGDVSTGWSKTATCLSHFACVNDDPVHDGNTTIITSPSASLTDSFEHENFTPSASVIDSVTAWTVARENATLSQTYTFSAGHPTTCANLPSLVPVLTQALTNYSTATYATNCQSTAWTVANLNALVTIHDSSLGDGTNPITSTATGITVAYRNDFYVDFTSTFNGVVGTNQALVYECTTTDETTTLDATISGTSAGAVTCDGGLNRLDISIVSGSVTVQLASAAQTGDLTQSTFAFDVLTLVSVVEEGGGGAPRADFTASYVWWENRVVLHDASTGTVGAVRHFWFDETNGLIVHGDANASYSPYGPLDMGVHEVVVRHTVVDEQSNSATVRKVVRIDNTPRFLIVASLFAIFVVLLAMYLLREKRGKRTRQKRRTVTFDPGRYLNKR